MDFDSGWELRRVRENGARLKDLRLERGISQNQLADESGVNVSQISRVESGRDAQLSTLLKIYRGLGYELRLDLQEFAEECGDLLSEEAARRSERRESGLLMGKRWR
jgi:transcriptional regulator with XRE-family HTH domain